MNKRSSSEAASCHVVFMGSVCQIFVLEPAMTTVDHSYYTAATTRATRTSVHKGCNEDQYAHNAIEECCS